jgi:hypothetical protein
LVQFLQTLPVLQPELARVLSNEKELPFESLEANVEITLVMFWLSHEGQLTSPILLVLNTSCSNDIPQSAQTYSKIDEITSQGIRRPEARMDPAGDPYVVSNKTIAHPGKVAFLVPVQLSRLIDLTDETLM